MLSVANSRKIYLASCCHFPPFFCLIKVKAHKHFIREKDPKKVGSLIFQKVQPYSISTSSTRKHSKIESMNLFRNFWNLYFHTPNSQIFISACQFSLTQYMDFDQRFIFLGWLTLIPKTAIKVLWTSDI